MYHVIHVMYYLSQMVLANVMPKLTFNKTLTAYSRTRFSLSSLGYNMLLLKKTEPEFVTGYKLFYIRQRSVIM